MPRAISWRAAVIDYSAQGLKESRSAVNLVDDDELSNLGAQKRVRILKAPLISRTLKVKVYGPPFPQVGDLASQRRFAHLPRAEKNDSWHLPTLQPLKGKPLVQLALHCTDVAWRVDEPEPV